VERLAVLELEHGRTALAVAVERSDELASAVEALGLGPPRPVVVVVGGAHGLSRGEVVGLEALAVGIVGAAAACAAAIVDGGTDAGVMRLVGQARSDLAARRVPLVGVAVRELAALPGKPAPDPTTRLDPRHTQFVLVPGTSWGDEAPWLAQVAGAIAGRLPTVTVLVNGGEVAWRDVAESLTAGRRVLVVAGSGRTADALAAVVGGQPGDERAAALVATGLVEVVGPGDRTATSLRSRITDILCGPGRADGF
jgi:hypothetical protein